MSTAHPGDPDSEGTVTTTLRMITHSARADEPTNPTTVYTPFKLTDQTNLLPFRKVVAVFAGLAICVVVSTLDSVITATVLPTISAYFNVGSVASWVPSAYMLTSTSFQPLYGRFSDIFGRKAAVCLAMSVFMLGCLIAGFSRNFIELVVWRGVAGVGGGGIISLAQIIISDVVSLRERYGLSIIFLRGFEKLMPKCFTVQRQVSRDYRGCCCDWLCYWSSYWWCPGREGDLEGQFFSSSCALTLRLLFSLLETQWCFWVNIPVSLAAVCVVLFVLPLKPVEGDVKRQAQLVFRCCLAYYIPCTGNSWPSTILELDCLFLVLH